MKLNIGKTIKRLRKEREITQEEFAEVMGVSCQSISRWENDSCYPDIEMIPTIAAFFGISVDHLMGIDEQAEKTAVDRYLNDFQAAVSSGDIDACIRIARAGVAEFPNNYALLNKLMYALFVAGDDTGNIPDWKENRDKYDAEIVALGERIIKYCPDTEIRFEATARLAFHYCELGKKEKGRAIYETLPSMSHCKEQAIWWALSEEEKLPYTRDFLRKSYDALSYALYRLVDLVSAEDALKVMDKMDALDALVYDSRAFEATWSNVNMAYRRAKCYAALLRYDEAVQQLKRSAALAMAFDNRPEEERCASLLLGEWVRKRSNFETADSRPLSEILRDSWLADKVFDSIRDSDEFNAILEQLK
ncbi:MAG: helix-turn-helix transcriptional regulator [Clostridia bacterium]|nr:helix-turn-helix transcriptional regulator [Clostridia bacterium]